MAEQRSALLVVSFGTSHRETISKTIEAIEKDLQEAFPERKFYRGWTSRMIIKILKEKQGIEVDTVAEALDRMKKDGITDVLIQPTHVMAGAENDRMAEQIRQEEGAFEKISIGRPLMDSDKDLEKMAGALGGGIMKDKGPEEALIFMGHGSGEKAEANRIYVRMEEAFGKEGYDDIFVSTVEGSPQLEETLDRIDAAGKYRKINLTPLMIVAGDHAMKDMAGEDEKSWKNRVTARGYEAAPIVKGLGEYEAIRRILVDHAKEAEKNG